jgi:hypothetical protein
MRPARLKYLGVSLVELLVALTITAGLGALLLGVTTTTMGGWRRAQEAFTTDAQAKLVLDFVERDFQCALFRQTGATWMSVDVITTPSALTNHGWRTAGVIKPSTGESLLLIAPAVDGIASTIGSSRFGVSGAWWRFICTNVESKSSSTPGGSQPVAISYQIARRPVSGSVSAANPAAIRYTLFRSAVAADVTFATGYDVVGTGYGSSVSTAPGARTARSLTNPNISDAIASNVVDFGVWLYVRQPSGALDRVFPATNSDLSHIATQRAEFPDVADVMVRVLTGEGAEAIAALERGASGTLRPADTIDAEWWWSIVRSHSRVYVRRIERRS